MHFGTVVAHAQSYERLIHVDQQVGVKTQHEGKWQPVQNIAGERCNVFVLFSIAQQPDSSILGQTTRYL